MTLGLLARLEVSQLGLAFSALAGRMLALTAGLSWGLQGLESATSIHCPAGLRLFFRQARDRYVHWDLTDWAMWTGLELQQVPNKVPGTTQTCTLDLPFAPVLTTSPPTLST